MDNQTARARADSMSLRPLLPWLLLASAISVTMMVLGVGRSDRLLPQLSAGLFAALIVGTSLGISSPLWSDAARNKRPNGATLQSALRCQIWLAALLYAWGASALFGMYSLSDLVWRHALQYASGAAVFAAGIAIYGLRLGRGGDATALPPLALSLVHGAAAAGGLVYLIGSDKLATWKTDWAANTVFLWGGIALIAVCAVAAMTQWRATRS